MRLMRGLLFVFGAVLLAGASGAAPGHEADLTIVQVEPSPAEARVRRPVTLRISFGNRGPEAATALQLRVSFSPTFALLRTRVLLPDGTEHPDAGAAVQLDPYRHVRANVPRLEPGTTLTLEVIARPREVGEFTVSGTLTSDQVEPTPQDSEFSTQIRVGGKLPKARLGGFGLSARPDGPPLQQLEVGPGQLVYSSVWLAEPVKADTEVELFLPPYTQSAVLLQIPAGSRYPLAAGKHHFDRRFRAPYVAESARVAVMASIVHAPAGSAGQHLTADLVVSRDPLPVLATGPGGGLPYLRTMNLVEGPALPPFLGAERRYRGGLRVAVGDLGYSPQAELVAGTGPGTPSEVIIFDIYRQRPIERFNPFEPEFHGGVYVAIGNVDGAHVPDIIVSTGPGGPPRVRVRRVTQMAPIELFPFETTFLGGVTVASADLDADGVDEIVCGMATAGGAVSVFSGEDPQERHRFFPYGVGHQAGVYVAAGDVDGDGRAEIITTSAAASGPARVFDGTSGELLFELAAAKEYRRGAAVAAGDLDRDGRAEIVLGPAPGSKGAVQVLSTGSGRRARVFPYGRSFRRGVYVAAGG
ncbi:MAG: FG-GAP repeat domain-containing protein [Armatimonadota bacterium]